MSGAPCESDTKQFDDDHFDNVRPSESADVLECGCCSGKDASNSLTREPPVVTTIETVLSKADEREAIHCHQKGVNVSPADIPSQNAEKDREPLHSSIKIAAQKFPRSTLLKESSSQTITTECCSDLPKGFTALDCCNEGSVCADMKVVYSKSCKTSERSMQSSTGPTMASTLCCDSTALPQPNEGVSTLGDCSELVEDQAEFSTKSADYRSFQSREKAQTTSCCSGLAEDKPECSTASAGCSIPQPRDIVHPSGYYTGPAEDEAMCSIESLDYCTDSSGSCCTEACAEALARHACRTNEDGPIEAVGSTMSQADRLQAAFDKYAAMLQKAMCLCKSLAAGKVVRCCGPTRSASAQMQVQHCEVKPQMVDGPRVTANKKESCQDICCKGGDVSIQIEEADLNCKDSCCSTKTLCKSGLEQKGAVQNSCCDSKSNTLLRAREVISLDPQNREYDTESAARYEDVQVNVQGMTCTGCENKLARSLKSIPGVSDVRIVFVSGRAEFKVDTSRIPVNTVILRGQVLTGFDITRIRQDLISLDFTTRGKSSFPDFEDLPKGAMDVEQLNVHSFRVFYDPYEVNARTLLDKMSPFGTLASADTQEGSANERKHLSALAFKTAIAIAFTVPVCVLAWAPTGVSIQTKAIVSLILATFVQSVAVPEFYWNAFRALIKSHTVELDMLVVISITAAYCYSVIAFGFLIAGHPLRVEEFFETSTLLISLVLLGRLIAGYARAKALASVSMRSLQTTTVNLLLDDGTESKIDVRLLDFGDKFSIPADTRIPTDGIILTGESEVDESVITGESMPVRKFPESRVIAGTMNGSGRLTATVDRLPGKNTITDIAAVVEAAQASKPKVQELADKLAGYFIPVVLVVALIVLVVWTSISLRVRGWSGGDAVVNAITYCIAVVAVSCPCALGLAVPMVVIITSGIAARQGILIKSASSAERAWSITDVVFDKTGTLTSEKLTVSSHEIVTPLDEFPLEISLSLAMISNHPVSQAVACHLKAQSVSPVELGSSKSLPGKGLEGKYLSTIIRAGNPQWLGVEDHPAVRRVQAKDCTLFCVASDKRLMAVFALNSTVRPEAASVVSQLQKRGLTTHIVSGDREAPVRHVADMLNIHNIFSHQSPKDKYDYVEKLISNDDRRVLFCGDGTNDAAAVARAHVGVSMGTASDVTGSAADVVLLGDLHGVVKLLDLSKAAHSRIVFNFVWAGLYNLFAILLAAGAFVTFRLPPAYAGLGELASVLPVVFAAGTMYFVSCRA